MENDRVVDHSRRKHRIRCVLILVSVLICVLVLAVVLGVTLSEKHSSFKNDVIKKCQAYLKENSNMARDNDCEVIWKAFEQAYVGRDPCDVPPEAYDPLINSVRQHVVCNTMLFWSKTKDTVKAFTDNRDCLVILERTLLGFVFDGLTWCSNKKSEETFTTNCPSWSQCENNPVRSFWNRASINFAVTACGNVSAMLNGSLEAPFSSTSVFGSVEVNTLDPSKVNSLTVLLVTKETDLTTCDNPSFQALQNTTKDKKIAYKCTKVPYSKVERCISDPEIPCSDCL